MDSGIPNAEDREMLRCLKGKALCGGDYVLDKCIGGGTFGAIYVTSENKKTGEKFACKCILSTAPDEPNEARLQSICSKASKGVAKIHRICHEWPVTYIIMDYCEDGDLFEYLKKGEFRNKDECIRNIFLQILDAVDDCHKVSVFHRDLKPENILLKDGGKKILISDFGFATRENTSTNFYLGSDAFMSPEVRGGLMKTYTPYRPRHVDAWALGVILLNICCPGYLPWEKASLNDPGFVRYIAQTEEYLLKTFPISNQLSNFLKRILDPEPERRMSISDMKDGIWGINRFSAYIEDGFNMELLGGRNALQFYETFAGLMNLQFINCSSYETYQRYLTQSLEDSDEEAHGQLDLRPLNVPVYYDEDVDSDNMDRDGMTINSMIPRGLLDDDSFPFRTSSENSFSSSSTVVEALLDDTVTEELLRPMLYGSPNPEPTGYISDVFSEEDYAYDEQDEYRESDSEWNGSVSDDISVRVEDVEEEESEDEEGPITPEQHAVDETVEVVNSENIIAIDLEEIPPLQEDDIAIEASLHTYTAADKGKATDPLEEPIDQQAFEYPDPKVERIKLCIEFCPPFDEEEEKKVGKKKEKPGRKAAARTVDVGKQQLDPPVGIAHLLDGRNIPSLMVDELNEEQLKGLYSIYVLGVQPQSAMPADPTPNVDVNAAGPSKKSQKKASWNALIRQFKNRIGEPQSLKV